MTSGIVETCVCICFLTFYILQASHPKRRKARGNFPPTLHLNGSECVNNALINALKK